MRSPAWTIQIAHRIRQVGPYAAIELILPGGSLIALLMWVVRHRAWVATQARRALTLATAVLGGMALPAAASPESLPLSAAQAHPASLHGELPALQVKR